MTNDERIERIEQELARLKRLVRWLPGATLLDCIEINGTCFLIAR